LPPDCLIAATALNFSFELFTDNKKDFDFIKGVKFYKY
jgi:predicted nucleic acid-binding protein